MALFSFSYWVPLVINILSTELKDLQMKRIDSYIVHSFVKYGRKACLSCIEKRTFV